jgi:putative FmdB family regulatory protein
MPTYEYECRKCGHRFEEFQSIKAEPLKACPRCRGKVQRLISGGAGLLFKGSGFHITDYRSESYKKKARGEGGAKVTGGAASKPADSSPAKAGGGGACGAGGCGGACGGG